ncbi:very short patch repair endonuclease [Methanocalculus taiwanensis]|uniref:Very short patch repair endonuclease n=1 Tax=Methanocalculus taiwanensis TaxID=106207 RepID=A0ABD4TJR8_9EURY|nr:very short patch repair endonuclease [Methanocalculus taiwanensis]MCQ1537757.1 very short patch repair endonuclease [Methanocalculus taiwanensis]
MYDEKEYNKTAEEPYNLKNPPPASSSTVKKVMRSMKTKDTKAEVTLRKALREIGLSGYRKNWEKALGKPDITYPGKKVAIFVHGCFWHGCPKCGKQTPKTHSQFWIEKISRNRQRDTNIILKLEESGWKVFVFWECEINKDVQTLAKDVAEFIQRTDRSIY